MPNVENIQKWHDALLSGEYEQGIGALEFTDIAEKLRHCCLGVACRVATANGVALEVSNIIITGFSNNTAFNGDTSYLPLAVQDWLGITKPNPKLVSAKGNEISSSSLNDSVGYSFAEIAKAIERTYLSD